MPDAGFSGIDTFTVQVTDSITPVDVTVNITVGEVVWYVNNETGPNNPPGSDGRSTDAFETLAEAQAASGPNSTIFVFNGLTAATPLTDSIALKNGQKLIGEGVGLTVAGFPTLVPAGTQPRIVASGDAVTVVANTLNGDRTGVEIRGLNLTSTSRRHDLGVRISETPSRRADFIVPAAVSPGTTCGVRHQREHRHAVRTATALAVRKLGGSGSWSGTIANNTVGVTGVSGSGSADGSGIFVLAGGTGTYTASITGNQVRQYGDHGIFAQADGPGVVGNAAMNLTVTGNTVTEPAAGGGPATNGFHLYGRHDRRRHLPGLCGTERQYSGRQRPVWTGFPSAAASVRHSTASRICRERDGRSCRRRVHPGAEPRRRDGSGERAIAARRRVCRRCRLRDTVMHGKRNLVARTCRAATGRDEQIKAWPR